MREEFDIRTNHARELVDEADAEVRDGKGVLFASSAALADEITRRGLARIALKRRLHP